METITIFFPKKLKVDLQHVFETVVDSSNVLTESIVEGSQFDYENFQAIEFPLNIKITEQQIRDISMKIFDLGINTFEIEISESLLTEAVLRRGSRGNEVRKLQLDLGIQPADGVFGSATERAVRDFQQRFNLTVDGIAGPATLRSIEQHQSIDTDDTREVEPSLDNSRWTALSAFAVSRQGGLANNPRQVNAIKELQRLLDIEATGRYDRATVAAVRNYQEENGLYVDGDAGPRTIRHIINSIQNAPITVTPLDPQDDSNPSDARPMVDLDAEGGRIQGPIPPAVAQQVRDAVAANDAITVMTLVNRYESLYNAFRRTPSSNNPDYMLYGEWSLAADAQREQQQGESLEETFEGDDFHDTYGILWYNEDEELDEAEYQGRKVKLGKPMRGDVKKFKVYVKNPKGNVVKVNFGDPDMKIKKSNPARRRSFRARHNCDNPGPRHKARYWSCRKW